MKVLGSDETEAQLIVLSVLRSRLEPSAGAVTCRANEEATRASTADAERVNCILACRWVFCVKKEIELYRVSRKIKMTKVYFKRVKMVENAIGNAKSEVRKTSKRFKHPGGR